MISGTRTKEGNFIHRFANILKLSNVSVNTFWSVLRETKVNAPFDLYCDKYGLYKEDGRTRHKTYQIEAVEKHFKAKPHLQRLTNMTIKDLEIAGKMFIYLNTCPSDGGDLQIWFESWFKFYHNLFSNQTPEKIILTLNRLMKTNKEGKQRARKLFKSLTMILSLSYEHIHNMIPKKSKSISMIEDNNSNGNIFETVANLLIQSINHPVHIRTLEDNKLSPSAFIPFCEFGGNMSAVGVKIKQFDVPVCNSFQAKVLNDQLCFEVDLNRFSNKDNIERELKLGFYFLMDYNEDRQFTYEENTNIQMDFGLSNRITESDQNQDAFIYLNTIGNNLEFLFEF